MEEMGIFFWKDIFLACKSKKKSNSCFFSQFVKMFPKISKNEPGMNLEGSCILSHKRSKPHVVFSCGHETNNLVVLHSSLFCSMHISVFPNTLSIQIMHLDYYPDHLLFSCSHEADEKVRNSDILSNENFSLSHDITRTCKREVITIRLYRGPMLVQAGYKHAPLRHTLGLRSSLY